MRVFVAGATGVLGKCLVPRLLDGGHAVVALTRSHESAARLSSAGAEPIVLDAFDFEALERAIVDSRPQVVINQLTALPKAPPLRPTRRMTASTNRLRAEVTPVMARAAARAGARRFVSQSMAFVYRPSGRIHVEDDPLYLPAPTPLMQDIFGAVASLEAATLDTPGIEGIVLRYGFFYGLGTWYAPDGAMGKLVAGGRLPIVGDGEAVSSFIHVDDAAAATVLALDHGSPGIYNIVDDEPLRAGDWIPAFADAIDGAPRPRRIPGWVVRILLGRYAAYLTGEVEGASNSKAREELGFTPQFGTFPDGIGARG